MKKEINLKILDLIYDSVRAECGDGDAIWLCKHTPLKEIYDLIEWYNASHRTNWQIKNNKDSISWGDNQEWVEITDNREYFNNAQRILKIDY